jgi:hypothetical protein
MRLMKNEDHFKILSCSDDGSVKIWKVKIWLNSIQTFFFCFFICIFKKIMHTLINKYNL